MLTDFDPVLTLPVVDLERAREFYEGLLGFAPSPGSTAEGVNYRAGSSSFLIYPSDYAGTNQATAMAFIVPQDAFDAEIAQLRSVGIVFQTFDAPGLTWDDGVASFDDSRAVWFTDPDGNIVAMECAPHP